MTPVECARCLVGVLQILEGLDANDATKVLTCARLLLHHKSPTSPSDIRTVPGLFDGSIAEGITDEQLERIEDEGGHVSAIPLPPLVRGPLDSSWPGPIPFGGLAPYRDPG